MTEGMTEDMTEGMTETQAIEALDAIIPAQARTVCARLSRAGYQAYTVGGAVRDAIMGRVPGDWDVATSATPEQVMDVFERTIATGIEHGTVTVLEGRGDHRLAVEVTSFRGEGAYLDGRHPESVTFGVPLHEDLARRDFVVNAMAYDPMTRHLVDPFGGRDDIDKRCVRAVGDPKERFAEDGLRVLRAVRFAAVLGFDLDPATEAAIPGALPVLAKVSRERVRVELLTLLGAAQPSRGLSIARRTGIVHAILPELDMPPVYRPLPPGDDSDGDNGRDSGDDDRDADREDRWARTLARVDAVAEPAASATEPDPRVARQLIRLAALLVDVASALPSVRKPAHPLRRLKLSNADIARVDRLLCAGLVTTLVTPNMSPNMSTAAPGNAPLPTDLALRQLLGRLGREHADDLLILWRADADAPPHMDTDTDADADTDTAERIATTITRVEHILARGDALSAADLALGGGDLIARLGITPGPVVGRLLSSVLARVLERPELNTPEHIEALARELL